MLHVTIKQGPTCSRRGRERERKERELEIAGRGGCVQWGLGVDGWMGGWTDVKNVKFGLV